MAVPALNAGVGRFFSVCKQLFNALRTGMAEETIEKWLQLSLSMEPLGMWQPVHEIEAPGEDGEEVDVHAVDAAIVVGAVGGAEAAADA